MNVDTPTPNQPRVCARYFGSDGTLCSTHHGSFSDPALMRCDRHPALAEPMTAMRALRRSGFSEYRKTVLTSISDSTFPPGTVYLTPEGLRSEDEDTRCAFDVQGGIYPIRESVFQSSYARGIREETITAAARILEGAHVLMRSGVVRDEGQAVRLAAEIVLTVQTGERYDRDFDQLTPQQNARLDALSGQPADPPTRGDAS